MPLSPPATRRKLHTRSIQIEGYQREDGLFDIEAHLTDVKTYAFGNDDRGEIQAGEPLHGMWMRMTIDEGMTIRECEAATEYSPYSICPNAAPNFVRLAGLRIRPGFLKEAAARVGGTAGCTHLRELLQQMATTAFQTTYPVRRRAENSGASIAPLLGTCYAYAPDSPVVRRRWPELAERAAKPASPA